ncbi:MAG: glycosyltransferase family 2 protein [Deferribacteraceae bacterium]|jgi:glycosyltransferase involved in cell wall biosynthesis|nr:glycosyltransferase family 2 protein [Deferribacteraceae bacterium]
MSKELSLVIPAYNEEKSIAELIENIVLNIQNFDYEILIIDDGSTDATLSEIKKCCKRYPNTYYISFRKNFGKALALQAGFENSHGDIVVTMDADLQDDPTDIKRMLDKLHEGYDLVSGWKVKRNDPIEKRLPSKLFNFIVAFFSGVKLHDFNCGFKAYRREVIQSLSLYGEMHRYIPVFAARNGFKIAELPVINNKRAHGKSKYGIKRYLRGLFDAVTVFFISKYIDKPMHYFGKIGISLLFVGIILSVYLMARKFILSESIGTRPLLMLAVLLIILGIQFFSVGLIGEMLVDFKHSSKRKDNRIMINSASTEKTTQFTRDVGKKGLRETEDS